jgi:two-component system, OmpR family, alkaline phosphatase synthesis response regulator PhoP
MNESILIVEDEEALRMTLGDRLRSTGYVVDFASDGEEGFEKSTQLPFDLIILDIMLPRRNGLDLCREVRKSGLATPILLLTARGQTRDKVEGFKLGADDYVTKPFDTLELLARIEALLRRVPARPASMGTDSGSGLRKFGPISVDMRGTQVTRDGRPVYLTLREFELLRYFIEHPGATLSRGELLREVWGYEQGTFTRTVDVFVASLRQKLEKSPKNPELIRTVAGIGYKFQS